jgi:Fe(3+) dicitrate transport protein
MQLNKYIFIISCLLLCLNVSAQIGNINGKIIDQNSEPIQGASIILADSPFRANSDSNGNFQLTEIPFSNYDLVVFAFGNELFKKEITLNRKTIDVSVTLNSLEKSLEEVQIEGKKINVFGISRMNSVEDFGIYSGKKNEVVELEDMNINMSTNNARQVYSKITGLNIWESDGAGIQLGIGGRGLSPDRTSNFNTRQNSYDISADPLGYPESYYTPPAEALDRIVLVRGAASLQYGTQFGGMANFIFKKGPKTKRIELTSRQTLGSWNYFGTFNSIGGTVSKGKLNYYSYYHRKQGDGYRENSNFDYNNIFAALSYQLNPKMKLDLELTKMYYLAHQAGGLTDKLFESDPIQSLRNRNWFTIDWNLAALNLSYEFNENTMLKIQNSGLISNRKSVGILSSVNVADLNQERTLIDGEFGYYVNETRLIHNYNLGDQRHTFLFGARFYQGQTNTKQGDAKFLNGAEFEFQNPDNLENSNYQFPNQNIAFFVENIFNVNSRLSLTPGIRFEYIDTKTKGFYKNQIYNLAGDLVSETEVNEDDRKQRNFVLFGLGTNYKLSEKMEVYANISQNYRAINFSDLRIDNPNFVVDDNISDETGYTSDIGFRTSLSDVLFFESTLFYLKYNGKIGQILKSGEAPLYNDYRFRGNIADAQIYGLEMFTEWNFLKSITQIEKTDWTIFANFSLIDATYINSEEPGIQGNDVEMVPPFVLRSGTSFRKGNFGASLQYSFVDQHFSDASNALRTATAIEGQIPSYFVSDLSISYKYKMMKIEGNVNNITDSQYFTRRAQSYPGPGIIPSNGRSFYITLELKL